MFPTRLIALCATLGLGCAQVPPPSEPAVAATTGVVAVAVELEMPDRYISFSGNLAGTHTATRVSLVRLEERAGAVRPGAILWSDHVVDDQALFLEVPPGRYAVAAAGKELPNPPNTGLCIGQSPVGACDPAFTVFGYLTAYLPDASIRSLVVDVKPGTLTHAGEVEVQLLRRRAFDSAQRHFYGLEAPSFASGRDPARYFGTSVHYAAEVRRIDQSEERLKALGEAARAELVEAGWPRMTLAGPTRLAAIEYPVPAITAADGGTGVPMVVSVVDAVRSEGSPYAVADFEEVLEIELREAGFKRVESGGELRTEVTVSELTEGSRARRSFSWKDGAAEVRYAVIVRDADGDVLGRADGGRVLTGKEFGAESIVRLSGAEVYAAQIDFAASDVARYVAALHELDEAADNWSDRPLMRISLTDAVGTEYSSAGSEVFEELVAADLRTAGYRTDGGGEGLTLEVEIERYDPGSRMKRLFGLPGMGSAALEWRATLVDASDRVLGDTEGKKRYTGYEILDSPTLKNDNELRDDMARHCAEQLGEYLRSLPIAHRSGSPGTRTSPPE